MGLGNAAHYTTITALLEKGFNIATKSYSEYCATKVFISAVPHLGMFLITPRE